MNIVQLMFQLSIVLFSVSSAFAVNMLIDRYPKIHRFGHSFSNHNLKVMVISWPLLTSLMVLSIYSLFRYSQVVEPEAVSGLGLIPHLLPPVIYFLLPPTMERVVTGAVLLAARNDFMKYCDCGERELLIDKRFSKETKDKIKESSAYATYMLTDSSVKYAMLLFVPILYHECGFWWWAILALVVWFMLGFVTEPLLLNRKS